MKPKSRFFSFKLAILLGFWTVSMAADNNQAQGFVLLETELTVRFDKMLTKDTWVKSNRSLKKVSLVRDQPKSRGNIKQKKTLLSITYCLVADFCKKFHQPNQISQQLLLATKLTTTTPILAFTGVFLRVAIITLLSITGIGLVAFIIIKPQLALGMVSINENEVGIVTKKFIINPFHRRQGTRSHRMIALNGDAGIQADTLGPGLYFWRWPFRYKIQRVPLTHIPTEHIGLVEAIDGQPLPPGQVFSQKVICNDFQDGTTFLKNGGQMGKQQQFLSPGSYRINCQLFIVRPESVTDIFPGKIGLVEAKYGQPLGLTQKFGQVVACDDFQDVEAFLQNGGQRGQQIAILKEGTYRINTELFKIRQVPVINVPQAEIALVVAKEGDPLPLGRTLGNVVDCDNFQNAEAFLKNGGQKGRQLAVLTEGIYQINTEMFTVITVANATQHGMKPEQLRLYTVDSDHVGIVTTLDGASISKGEFAGSTVEGHDQFQNPQQFINNGGYKGLQEEVLTEGDYYLNPWFIKVEQVPLVKIETGSVGVVISHVGKIAETNPDVEQIKGEYKLVDLGYKGIWKTPLLPGKHPINIRTMSVERVPTNPITLKWSDDETKPEDNYDKNLRTLQVYSKDNFSFSVELTQVIRIAPEDSPTMIANVGSQSVLIGKTLPTVSNSSETLKYSSINNLVVKILEPLVSAYFQNSAMQCDALEFRKKRAEQQRNATDHIDKALKVIGVQGDGTFISKIDLPDVLENPEQRGKIAQLETQALEQEKLQRQKEQEIELQTKEAQIRLQDQEERAKVAWQRLMDQVEAEKLRDKTQIEAELKRLLKQVDIDALMQTIEQLSPELYTQLESNKAWAEGLGKHKGSLVPQTLFNSGEKGSGTGNTSLLSDLLTMGLLNQGNQQNTASPVNPSEPSSEISPVEAIASIEAGQVNEPSLPILLVLDTSNSMSDECINKLSQGIVIFKQELEKDPNASRRIEVATISIGATENVIQGFTSVNHFSSPQLTASETAILGKKIELALEQIEKCCAIYERKNIQYYRPWVFLIVGSTPTDNWQNVASQISEAAANRELNFFVVGIEGVDMDILSQISPPGTPPVMLEGWKFKEMFQWLADALKRVSRSEVDSGGVELPPITEWAKIDGIYRQ